MTVYYDIKDANSESRLSGLVGVIFGEMFKNNDSKRKEFFQAGQKLIIEGITIESLTNLAAQYDVTLTPKGI